LKGAAAERALDLTQASILYHHSYRALVLAFAVFAAACVGSDATRQDSLTLRGPLATFVAHPPASLAGCDSLATQYAAPFWRAPYRRCASILVDSGHQVTELDADTIVIQVVTEWRVPGQTRNARFAALETALRKQYGDGFRCSPRRTVWLTTDSLRISLDLQPDYGTDVGPFPADDSVSWRLQRFMRRGPLLDLLWCDAARRQLGA